MRSKLVGFISLMVLLAALVGGVVLVRRVQETRRGAAGGGLPVSFLPEQGNYQLGEEITVYLYLGPAGGGEAISTFSLGVSYPADLLEAKNIGLTEAIGSEEVELNTLKMDEPGEIIIIGGVREPEVRNQAWKIAKLVFTVRGEGRAEINLLESKSEVVTVCLEGSQGCQEGVKSLKNEFTVNPARYSLGEGGGEERRPTIELSLDPEEGEKKRGEEFAVSLWADTGENSISGAEIIFTFDSQKLRLERAEVNQGKETAPFDSGVVQQPEEGKVRVVGLVSRPLERRKSGQMLLVTYYFTPLQLGVAEFSLDKADFSGKTPQGEDLIEERIIPSDLKGRYTVVEEGAVSPQLEFKIKFAGVENKIDPKTVNLKVKKAGFEKEFRQVRVVADNQGILTGRVDLTGVPPGEGYYFIIKGPKHLAQKFCLDGQKERCRSHQRLTIREGKNQFDFSGYPLEPGDIPDENGQQDGVVDAQDFDRLKRALISRDESLRERANLDFNRNQEGKNIINGRDISLFLNTLRHRYDDED